MKGWDERTQVDKRASWYTRGVVISFRYDIESRDKRRVIRIDNLTISRASRTESSKASAVPGRISPLAKSREIKLLSV
jgi:hypothetical protein